MNERHSNKIKESESCENTLTTTVFNSDYIDRIMESIGKGKIVDVANLQLQNKYYVFKYIPQEVDELSDLWSCDFYSGYKWKNNRYFRKTILRPGFGADIKVPWESARCHHIVSFAFAYLVTNDDKYIESSKSYLIEFMKANPVNIGINWVYSMEVSIRLINLIIYTDTLQNRNINVPLKLDLYIKSCIKHILNNLEWRGGIRNNHYFVSLFGVYFASLRYKNECEYKQIAEFSFKEIIKELNFHVLPDGGGAEISTGYHKLNVECLDLFLNTYHHSIEPMKIQRNIKFLWKYLMIPIELKIRRVTDKDLIEARSIISEAKLFLKKISSKDGVHPQIGDNDSGRIIKVSPITGDSYSWSSGVYYLDDIDINYNFSYGSSKLPNYKIKNDLSIFKSQKNKSPLGYTHFPLFGLIAIYSNEFIFTIKDEVVSKIPGHFHDDFLSITLYSESMWKIRDNGSYSYNKNRDAYHASKSKNNHNISDLFGIIKPGLSIKAYSNGLTIHNLDKDLFFIEIKEFEINIFISDILIFKTKKQYPDYFI